MARRRSAPARPLLRRPTAEEGAELGPLLRDLSIALGDVTGCTKTYVMQFAEAEGFAHLHIHLVPRMPDQPAALRGPAVFGYLSDDETRLAHRGREGCPRAPAADGDGVSDQRVGHEVWTIGHWTCPIPTVLDTLASVGIEMLVSNTLAARGWTVEHLSTTAPPTAHVLGAWGAMPVVSASPGGARARRQRPPRRDG